MKRNFKAILSWAIIIVIAYAAIFYLQWYGYINPFVMTTLVLIGINIMLASGLNLIIGFSGQFSLGHAGFMAIGSYSTAVVLLGMPTYLGLVLGLLLGIVLSGLVALLVGIPTLRLKGDYLAIATLGISEIIRVLIVNMDSITQGPSGLFGIPNLVTWPIVFVATVIVVVFLSNFINSASGRINPHCFGSYLVFADRQGCTTKYKVMAFVIGVCTASLAGGLYASYLQTIMPGDFSFMKSVDILIIVVFGGLGSLTGTVISATVLGIINMYLQSVGDLRMIIYSLALIIIMIFRPSGLLGTKELSLKRLFRKRERSDSQ